MKISSAVRSLLVSLFTLLCTALPAFAQSFSWNMTSAGTVSVGIYKSNGQLVRTIMAVKQLPSGTHYATWDGLDNVGEPAPSGTYTWKVAVNGNTYTNGWQLGNSGVPTNTSGHVPIFIESVAVDASGNVYSVNGWDEAHRDVIKWSGSTGNVILSSGQVVQEQVFEGVAVEPDGTIAYTVGVAYAGDPASLKSSIRKVDLATISMTVDGFGKTSNLVNFTSPNGPIVVYNGGAQYPSGATNADKDTMSIPIRSLALRNTTLYAPDSLGNRVLMYDKTSGSLNGTISNVPVACGIAVHSNGNIFVGSGHSNVRVYNSTGSQLLTTISGFTEVRSLAITGNTLFAADMATGQIKKYTIGGDGYSLSLSQTFGSLLQPGDRAFNKLSNIRGIAADSAGNLIVSDRSGDGTRLQKLNANLDQQLWQKWSLEFACSGSFSSQDTNLFITSSQHAYSLDRSTGAATYLGNARSETEGQYFGNFARGEGGPANAVRLYNNDFFYIPTVHGGVAVYKVIPSTDPSTKGPTLKLISGVSAGLPQPDGTAPVNWEKYLWTWNDSHGRAITEADTDKYAYPTGSWAWVNKGISVDNLGQLLMCSAARGFSPNPSEHSALWVLKPTNVSGNPAYYWDDSHTFRILSAAAGRAAIGVSTDPNAAPGLLEWRLAGRASDGMVYALGSTNKPGVPNDGGLNVGGTVLMGFQESNPGTLQAFTDPTWKMFLSQVASGLTPIEGNPGGVFVGGDVVFGKIHHYAKDGLLVGTFGPGANLCGTYGIVGGNDWPTGAFDAFQCLSCDRGADGVLDVFAADNLNQRIIWYRVNDTQLSYPYSGSISGSGNGNASAPQFVVNNGIGSGKFISGTTAYIRADDPPAGKVFTGWTATGGAVIQNASAIATSVTIPSGAATVTANYAWASGNDQIRFFPKAGNEDSMSNSVWEGANDMNGPWTVFYDIPNGVTPPAGWNTASVNMGGFRYLRWRKLVIYSQGLVSELEFKRNGVTVTGPQFGTAAADTTNTWQKAVDGNTSTFFLWENTPYPGSYVGVDSGVQAQVATPTFSPAAGNYSSSQTVTISCSTSGATIRYTTDGSTPTSSSGTVGTSVTISSSCTLKAIAYKSGLGDSNVASGAYTITLPQVAAPTFSPGQGTYTSAQTVTISTTTSGATVRYTLDGSTPSQTNSTVGTSVNISSTATLKAIAYKSGMTDSSVTSATITITSATDSIRFHPRQYHEGRMTGGVFEGTNGDKDTGSYTAIYTIASSPASGWNTVNVGLGTYRYLRYRSPANGYCNIAELEFYRGGIKQTSGAFGTAGSYSGTTVDNYTAALDNNTTSFFDSTQASGAYVGVDTGGGTPQVEMPVISPGAGTYSSTQTVSITCPTAGATVRYTTNGSTPSQSNGTVGNSVTISATTQLKAIAYKSGMTDSGITSATFTINLAQVAEPTFSPGAGTYSSGQTVTINCSTAGATIRYTTDGSTPSQSNGTIGSSVTINSSCTLKAIAYKSGMSDSPVLSGDYTIGGGGAAVDKIRFYPRQGLSGRMIGGVFEGTNGDKDTGTYTQIYTITVVPPVAWSDVQVPLGTYRYLRYRSPADSYGNVAEIEFYRNNQKLSGTVFGTSGSYSGTSSDDRNAAFDNNTTTFFDSASANGAYVGLDTGYVPPQVDQPTFSVGAGTYSTAQVVAINCSTAGATIRYTTNGTAPSQTNGTVGTSVTIGSTTQLKAIAYKSGMADSSIASATYTINLTQVAQPTFNPPAGTYSTGQTVTISCGTGGATVRYTTNGSTPSSTNGTVGTTVTINSSTTLKAIAYTSGMADSNVTSGDYTITPSSDSLRFYPRQYHEGRMVGGIFEGTNGDPSVSSNYTTIYTISATPPTAWTTVNVSLGGFRYLRYRSPANGYCNVSEIEFYRNGSKLNGTGYGTAGSYSGNSSDDFTAALDGNTNTFFDSTNASGASVGIDSGSGQQQVALPTFTPGGGTYSASQNVSLLCSTVGATIRYTTDGSNPTSSSGTIGTSVTINGTCTLKAIAYKSGMADSAVASTSYTITAANGTGLTARYYNDPSNSSYPLGNPFAGSPVLTRTDATVDFNWGDVNPGSPVTSDNFSAKWTGQVKAPVSGSYTFTIRGDDGIRLYINGVLVSNGWTDHGASDFDYTTTLTAGTLYNIELQFYEHGGGAECRLQWAYPGQAKQAIPQSALYPGN